MTTRDPKHPCFESMPPRDRIYDHLRFWSGTIGDMAHEKYRRRGMARASVAFERMVADLGPGDLAIDLGANMGVMSIKMAAKGADVIAFEPDPSNYDHLVKAVADYPTIQTHQKAAGARDDVLSLGRSVHWTEGADDPSTQSSSIFRRDETVDDSNSVQVEVVDFPRFLRELDRDIRLVKVDIEGSEFDLMEALLDDPVMARIETIFVETHERFDPDTLMPRLKRIARRTKRMRRPVVSLEWC